VALPISSRLQLALGALFVLCRRPAMPSAPAFGALAVQPIKLARVGGELGQRPILLTGRAPLQTIGVPGLPHLLDLLRRPSAQRRLTDPKLDPVARSADGAVPVQHAPVRLHPHPRRLTTHTALPTGPYPDDQLTHIRASSHVSGHAAVRMWA